MSKLTYYRQKRMDGGTRTGVEVGGVTVLGRFEHDAEETDPVLRWYVDLRCEGARLPGDPEAVRNWLLDNAGLIRDALHALAEELRAGMDFDTWPLQWKVPKGPRGVRMTIVCSVTRRLDARDIARVLADIAAHWEEVVGGLLVGETAVR